MNKTQAVPLEPLVQEPEDDTDLYVSDEYHTLPHVFQLKQDLELRYWPASKITMLEDRHQWQHDTRVTDQDRRLLGTVLGFFAGADGVVMENLILNLMTQIKDSDARAFFAYQVANEQAHNEAYNRMLHAFYEDQPAERQRLRRAAKELPFVARKQQWMLRWVQDCVGRPERVAQLLAAFMCVEGVFFSSSFAFIFWYKIKGLFPGVSLGNEYIVKDEAYHLMNLMLLFRQLRYGLPDETLYAIFREATEVEKIYVHGVLQDGWPGLTPAQMCDYVEYSVDRILRGLGKEPLYGTANPLEWMDMIAAELKGNFFETRIAEYELDACQVNAPGTGKTNALQEMTLRFDEEV